MESVREERSPELALGLFHERCFETEKSISAGVDGAVARVVRRALAAKIGKRPRRPGIEEGAGNGQFPQGGWLHVDVGGAQPVPALQGNALQEREQGPQAVAVFASEG